jgi:nondiscriminating glutamyl-tRNA synthetase
MSYGAEIVELSQMFFTEELNFNDDEKEVLAGEQVPEVMAAFKEKLEALEIFEPAEIKKAIKAVQKETGHKGKNLYMPIRVATTGEMHGPELNDALVLLGKETVLNRVGKYVK